MQTYSPPPISALSDRARGLTNSRHPDDEPTSRFKCDGSTHGHRSERVRSGPYVSIRIDQIVGDRGRQVVIVIEREEYELMLDPMAEFNALPPMLSTRWSDFGDEQSCALAGSNGRKIYVADDDDDDPTDEVVIGLATGWFSSDPNAVAA